ncbi:MAG: IclR family transcriptional regulator [Mycobacteriaceae bacterium]
MVATNNSVDKAISLLRLLAASNRSLRFTDLQAQSGIAKGTLHSLLASLEKADFVSRSAAGYEIGVGAFEVGTAVRAPSSLRTAAAPLLDHLFEEHGEACHFGMLYQGDVVYLDRRDSSHALRYASRVGTRKPAYATALGKAMLGLQPDSAVQELYPARLPALTATTLTRRSALVDSLNAVRANGYATESEESTPGVCCIGVAGRTNDLVYGLSITVPVQRARLEDLPKFLPSLKDTIVKLERALKATDYFDSAGLEIRPPAGESD